MPVDHKLAREYLGIALVVGEAGQNRDVGGQSLDSQPRNPALADAIEKIVGDVYGVAGAAAVAAQKDAAAGSPAIAQGLGQLSDGGPVGAFQRGMEPVGIVQKVCGLDLSHGAVPIFGGFGKNVARLSGRVPIFGTLF